LKVDYSPTHHALPIVPKIGPIFVERRCTERVPIVVTVAVVAAAAVTVAAIGLYALSHDVKQL
jgi:hypothetical protein